MSVVSSRAVTDALLRHLRSTAQKRSFSSARPGLFGFDLQQPEDWAVYANETIQHCGTLVQAVDQQHASSDVISSLDGISDAVCQAYDSANFCSIAHSEASWRDAARSACNTLAGYVQELNMHAGLHKTLDQAMGFRDKLAYQLAASGTPEQQQQQQLDRQGFTEEASLVGRGFLLDFEKCGVHLDRHQQQQLAQLTHQVHVAGAVFGQALADPQKMGHAHLTDLQRLGLPAELDVTRGDPNAEGVLVTQDLLGWVLRSSSEPALRKQVYLAGMQSPQENVGTLQQLIAGRHALAQTMGCLSFSQYTLAGASLAGTPAAVDAFLNTLSTALHPKVHAEVQVLRRCKAQHLRQQGQGVQIDPWDQSFYMQVVKHEAALRHRSTSTPSFRLTAAISALGALMERLFGVRMLQQELRPGEAWAAGIIKYGFLVDGELMGSLYLDLYSRLGKFGNAAHFTLRCGRKLPHGSRQKPLVALVCNFGRRQQDRREELTHGEVETLFHEFGHALTSLLSCTTFQHMSGTRGPMDIVEVASHVMQLFARDERVLAQLMPTDYNGNTIPTHALQMMLQSAHDFDALDVQQQVVDSKVDQLICGPSPPAAQHDLSEAIRQVYMEHSACGLPADCLPPLRSTHLVGYGAQYYSYLYAKCTAAAVWRQYFAADPFDRDAGSHVRKELFEIGSARPPHKFVQRLVGEGCFHSVAGGWAPDAASFMEDLAFLA